MNFDQDGFQFTWINSDTLRIGYSVNRPKSHCSLLTYVNLTFVQVVNYPVTDYDPKIIRRIVNMRIKCYSQLIDIVNFCGKQGNISSSKKAHGSGLLSVVK